MKAPTIYKLKEIYNYLAKDTPLKDIDGKYTPARPEGYYSLTNQFKCAWLAFTGKADLVIWGGGQ